MSVENYIFILGMAALWFACGALWYSPLLAGNMWMKAHGRSMEELQAENPHMVKSMGMSFLICFLQAAIMGFIIGHVKIQSVLMAAIMGLMLAAAFGVLSDIRSHYYLRRNLRLVWIDRGYDLLAAPVVAALMAWYLHG